MALGLCLSAASLEHAWLVCGGPFCFVLLPDAVTAPPFAQNTGDVFNGVTKASCVSSICNPKLGCAQT